jgi:hypothetical protein
MFKIKDLEFIIHDKLNENIEEKFYTYIIYRERRVFISILVFSMVHLEKL